MLLKAPREIRYQITLQSFAIETYQTTKTHIYDTLCSHKVLKCIDTISVIILIMKTIMETHILNADVF